MTPGRLYRFGRFRLDGDAHLLFRDDARIPLTPKAVDVLLTLVENRGTCVPREELFGKVWADAVVEDGTLSSHISLLRRALGAGYIETIPKRGYRFVGMVEEKRPESTRVLLAVLPFENLSGGRKDEAFSDGLTEEMITQLGRLNPARLGVIARTSAMTYKSTKKSVEEIGRELGVAYVLEGSVRRGGARVRIAAQLIVVSDQTHVWAESYEGSLEDILALQSSVARDVARQIRVKLLRTEKPRQIVPAAYEAYLKGRFLWSQRSEGGLRTSLRFYEEAIACDPEYAPSYTGMADAYLTLMDYGHMRLSEAVAKARPLALKALELDADLAEPHISLGHAAFHEFDWPAAERELLRGVELNPNYAIGHFYYANYLAAMARMEESIREAEHATHLDPVSPSTHSNLASMFWYAGENVRAIERAGRSLELNPNYASAFEDMGRAYEQLGQFDDAIKSLRKAIALTSSSHNTLASLGHALALAGKKTEATKILRRLQIAAKAEFVPAYYFALLYMGLGKKDDALDWLEKAYEERSPALTHIQMNPRFKALRGSPRYKRLMSRLRLG
jgi:TolB-like protein/Flp pilus assembly protein TadD